MKTPDEYSHYANWPGYVKAVKNPLTGFVNTCWIAKEQDLDDSDGKYVTICEMHGTICNHRTKKLALAHLPLSEWCEACMGILSDQA